MFRSARHARRYARRVGAIRGQWWSANQSLHHGGGEYCALAAKPVDFGLYKVGVNYLTRNGNAWVSAGQHSVGHFVAEQFNEGWITPAALVRWVTR